jgi:hypothetical protein
MGAHALALVGHIATFMDMEPMEAIFLETLYMNIHDNRIMGEIFGEKNGALYFFGIENGDGFYGCFFGHALYTTAAIFFGNKKRVIKCWFPRLLIFSIFSYWRIVSVYLQTWHNT